MSNKLNNTINNTQKSYVNSLFSDSEHNDNSQNDSDSLDSSVLVGEASETSELKWSNYGSL